MPSTIRRQIYLGRVQIDLPRLMSDEQLATVLDAFVREVRARPRKELPPASQPQPGQDEATEAMAIGSAPRAGT
jgi:hypothetical protein